MSGKLVLRGAETERDGLRAQAWRRACAFRKQEDGSLLIFGLFCFVMMLLLAGVALDVMRFEELRTTLQNTTDRAVLAAADLRQTLDPKAVVKDYFAKAGLAAPADSDIVVNQGNFNEWRTVQASVHQDMPTWFMNMYGIKTMTTPGAGTAEERIGQVEVSLVLDVSGSMSNNNKLVNLKPAAKSFIDQMFSQVEAGKLSMSIVPYSTQVSVGPGMMQYFANTAEQTNSSCLEFGASDFTTTAMQPKTTDVGQPAAPGDRVYQRNGHFDPFYTTTSIESQGLWNCPPDVSAAQNANNNRTVMAFSGDQTALKAKIDTLVASGNTSIDLGMKWGSALLDPSMNPVVTRMIAAGTASANFASRPYPYSNHEVLKVIVLMTDGENTTEYKLRSAYENAVNPSLLRRNSASTYNNSTSVNQYSLWDASKNQYWVFALGQWRAQAWGDGVTTSCTTKKGKTTCTDTNDTGYDGVHPMSRTMTWPDVWKAMSINYFARYLIYPVYGTSTYNSWLTSASNPVANTAVVNTTMDTYTLSLCSAAKTQGVKIFTIGFEASTAGQNLLTACATSPAHYYSAAGVNITTAFASIASSINKLRLTH